MVRDEEKKPEDREGWWSSTHREACSDRFRWVDLDQIVYAEPDANSKVPCVLIETISINNSNNLTPEFINSERQIYNHKRMIYLDIANALDIPAFALWYTPEVERFYVRELSNEDNTLEELDGWGEYQEFLDGFLERVFEEWDKGTGAAAVP